MNRQTNEKQTNARTQRNRTQQTNRMVQSENRSSPPEQRKVHAVGIGHGCVYAGVHTSIALVAVLACFLNSQKPNEEQKTEQPNELKAK